MADKVEIEKKKKKAGQHILDKYISTVTSVIKANPDNFFLQLLENSLVTRDSYDLENIALSKVQKAAKLYSQCGTAVGLNSLNFSKVLDILSGYPLLDQVVEEMQTEGEKAGLMSSSAATSASQAERASDKSTGISRGSTGSSKLDSEPDDINLRKLVATKVADSDTLGIMLKLETADMDMIKRTEKHPASVNMKMFSQWKEEETREPVTWRTLIEALQEMKMNRLARQVKEKVEEA